MSESVRAANQEPIEYIPARCSRRVGASCAKVVSSQTENHREKLAQNKPRAHLWREFLREAEARCEECVDRDHLKAAEDRLYSLLIVPYIYHQQPVKK